MAANKKFLKRIRESAEADLPTSSSDAASEVPDSLSGKVGARAVKAAHDGAKAVDSTSAVAAGKKNTVATEEVEDEKKAAVAEDADSDLPTSSSAAKASVADSLDEEEDDANEKKAVSESDGADEDDKEISESDYADADDKKEVSEEEEDEVKLSEEDEEKLSEEEDEEVKEAADALTKDEQLPESFKTKVAAIFEAAVKRAAKKRTDALNAKLVEAHKAKLAKKTQTISETLVNKVDGYLDYVVEEWMKQNEVAIESSLRSNVTEKFIVGLKTLFESHYIEVPAEKTDVLTQQEKKIAELERELNEQLARGVEIRKENIALKRSTIVKKHTEGLTVSDAAKFADLCEGVAFESAKTFSQKLQVIKETYFPKTPRNSGDLDASLLTEGGLEHQESTPATGVDVYAETISRMLKR
jgi:hypothetical protein